ncbi:hypothetical protein BVY02_02680 [bacterium J17]|nr:hypothetical protein BVY02_02680 [bacterium J17]
MQFTPADELSYCIDNEPSVVGIALPTLCGWAVNPKGPLTFQLRFRGQTIHEFACSVVRLDISRSYPNNPFSSLSGFELDFPLHLLRDIGPDLVSLVIKTAEGEKEIWKWAGSPYATNASDLSEQFRTYFSLRTSSSAFEVEERSPIDGAANLAIYIRSKGGYSFLIDTLRSLKEKLSQVDSSLAKPSSLTVLADGVGVNEVKAVLEAYQSEFSFSPAVLALDQFTGWSKTSGVKESELDRTLVLHLDESLDYQGLCLRSLLTDFVQMTGLSVFMPAIYGGEGGLKGKPGVSLLDFRKKSSVSGSDIPCLFPTNELSAVWLSTLAFLDSLEKEYTSVSGEFAFVSPPDGSSLYHIDLRQPLHRRESLVPGYRSDVVGDMQEVIRLQIQFTKEESSVAAEDGEPNSNERVVFLLPANWTEASVVQARVQQVIRLAEELRSAGVPVYFVSDGKYSETEYLKGFSTISLESYLEENPDEQKGWVIAASWCMVRAAYTLAYTRGLEVAQLIQDRSDQLAILKRPEFVNLAFWAYRSQALPICNTPGSIEHIEAVSDAGSDLLSLPFIIDDTQFLGLPLERQANTILLITHGSEASSRIAARIEKTLKKEKVDALVTKVDLNADSTNSALLNNLYTSNAVVVDCAEDERLSSVAVDASSCGAKAFLRKGNVLAGDDLLAGSELFDAEDVEHFVAERLVSALKASLNAAKTEANAVPAKSSFNASKFVGELAKAQKKLVSKLEKGRKTRAGVSLVIPVYGALDATVACLKSVLRTAPENYQIIVVNDASDEGTSHCLRSLAASEERITLIDKDVNAGFVQACISGVAAAKPENDIVLLNSDVVLTQGALEEVQNSAYARHNIGLVSALSTNSPHLEIELNPGDSLETAAKKIKRFHSPKSPTIITAEGQLMYIRRWALERYGFFDPVFNRGFCEESDLCMRMFLHGVDMVAADNALICHRKSASFGKEGGLTLKRENRPIFDARWAKFYELVYPEFLKRDPLREVRDRYLRLRTALERPYERLPISGLKKFTAGTEKYFSGDLKDVLEGVEVVFVLPSVILGGGTLSVLQHVNELLLRGVEARVITLQESSVPEYPLLAPPIAVSCEQFFNLKWTNQKVVATFWLTAYLLRGLLNRFPELQGYYYVQDYEPWFYSLPENFHSVKEAEGSYHLGLKTVAKTDFLRAKVKELQGVDVSVITPGLSRSIFYPGVQQQQQSRPRVSAYYRLRTPRRGARESLEVLKLVKRRLPEAKIVLFGENAELSEEDSALFETAGRLVPEKVAELYRNSDVVLDMSHWHGFGRMGIEAMAAGAVPVLTKSGGVNQYAQDGVNCSLVEVGDVDAAVDRVVELLVNRPMRLEMRKAALKQADKFSEEAATDDWLALWGMDGRNSAVAPLAFSDTADSQRQELDDSSNGLKRTANL